METKIALVIAAVAVAAAVYVTYRISATSTPSYRMGSLSGEPDVRQLFIDAVSTRLDKVAECIATEFRQRYDLETAKGLINVEAFKNNQQVRQILEQCAFNVIQHVFSIVTKSVAIECESKRNPAAVVRWIVNNVEFKIYTDAEIDEIVKQVYQMTCWTVQAIAAAVKATREKVHTLLGPLLTEPLRGPFFSDQKYTKWVQIMIVAKSIENFDPDKLPGEYTEFISSISLETLDRHVDGAVSKLVGQIKIADYIYANSWCKDIPAMLSARSEVPFEIYTDEQVQEIGKAILAKWCWDPQTIVGPTRQILNSVL